MGKRQIKEVSDSSSGIHDYRSQPAYYHKASIVNGLLVKEILLLRLTLIWKHQIKKVRVSLSGGYHDPSMS